MSAVTPGLCASRKSDQTSSPSHLEDPSGSVARGAAASDPTDIPATGRLEVLRRVWANSGSHDLNLLAAAIAFYAFISLVPLLAVVVMIYGLVANPSDIARHMSLVIDVVPADAAHLIYDQLAQLEESATGKKGLSLLVAGLVSLYGASRAASAVIASLNVIYEQHDRRGIFRGALVAVALAACCVFVALSGLLAAATLGWAETLAARAAPPGALAVQIATWAIAAALCSLSLAAMYRFAPHRADARWRWLSLGAICATILWLAATVGFGLYAANFANYDAMYGSLGAVVVLMMWLYLSAYAVLLGALINAEIERQTAVDSTTGPTRPMGERGARMADTSAALTGAIGGA